MAPAAPRRNFPMLDLAVLAIFPGIMVFAAISDLLTMTIPNRVSAILLIGFFALSLAIGLPLATIGWHVAAGALWLCFGVLGMYGILAAIFGGALTLFILQLRRIRLSEERWAGTWIGRLHDKTVGVPYGVALAAAGLAVYPDTAIWLAAKAV
jgi:prepilin peptidase CpaA